MFTLLLLKGNFFDIVCDINPDYKQHVRFKYGRNKLYLRILKVIYGMIESALLWYEIYVSLRKDMGFQLNTYYMCVANKNINGKQCAIDWYVYDNNISYVEQDTIDNVIIKAEESFLGLTVKKGNVHTLLGIKIRQLKNRRIAINMK